LQRDVRFREKEQTRRKHRLPREKRKEGGKKRKKRVDSPRPPCTRTEEKADSLITPGEKLQENDY